MERLLDALACVVGAGLDPWGDDRRFDPTGTDGLVLGRCSADGYAMVRSESGHTWRPWNYGQADPCPADPETYVDTDGTVKSMGLCREATFEPWKPGKQ